MSNSTETKLLTSTTALLQVVQPPAKASETQTATPVVAPSGASDSVDENLSSKLEQNWNDFLTQAETEMGGTPAPDGQKPVTKTTAGSATTTDPLPSPEKIDLPGPPAQEKPEPPTPARVEVAPERQSITEPKTERPGRTGPAGEGRKPEDVRQDVARDRAQLETRAAETEQFAREVSARETKVQEYRSLASAKRSEAAQLRSRVAERRLALGLFELEMESVVSQPGAYLERFEEVERMQMLRFTMQAELHAEEHASREAELEADRYARLVTEHESSLVQGRLEVERRRTEMDFDRAQLERKATEAERSSGLMEHSVDPGALSFWSALARAGEVDQAAWEARRAQERLDAHDQNPGGKLLVASR